MTSNFEYEYVRGADGRILERHILPNIKDSTVEAGTIILLNREDELSWTDVQTAFDSAQNMKISGGFSGINAPEEALEFSNLLLQDQLDRDASMATLEMTVLMAESDRLEADILEIESARPALWGMTCQDQYVASNGTFVEPVEYKLRASNYPSHHSHGPALHTKSSTQVPRLREFQPAHPTFPRVQTESQLRREPSPMDSDTSGSSTRSRRHLD